MDASSNYNIAFFGTSRFATEILVELEDRYGIYPSLVVTTPDKPVGRKQIITPSPVKKWALRNSVPLLQPEKLKDPMFLEALGTEWDAFIVASYGKIIPKIILGIPRRGTLNIHPSLLPRYRGASPIQSQILNDEKHVGTTIMLMDEDIDHGAIIAQREVTFNEGAFPQSFSNLETILGIESAELLGETFHTWMKSEMSAKTQDHSQATFTTLIKKEDGELTFDIHHPEKNARENYLKYLAYEQWPGTFFFINKNTKRMRILIKKASFENETFIPEVVVPEGKKEILYGQFLSSLLNKH